MIDNFLALLDEAHQLRIDHPRYPISPSFGRELATMALENNRLADAVDWLWHTKPNSATTTALSYPHPKLAQMITRFAFGLSRTRWGHKMIQNQYVKAVGKSLLKYASKQGAA